MLTTVEEIVDLLGGPSAAARALGQSAATVGMWKVRGSIPAEHYFAVYEALKAAGAAEPVRRLFGFNEPVAAQ